MRLKKSLKAFMTEVSKLTNGVEKKLQDENVSKIKQLELENENLKSKGYYLIELFLTLVARDELQELQVENSNLKEQIKTFQIRNSALNAVIQEMKLILEGQLGKFKKAERIPCSICKNYEILKNLLKGT